MLKRSKAIVLRTLKYSDNAVIVEVYTASDGRVSYIVRIPKSHRAAVKNVLFTPLALLEIEWNSRPASNLQHIHSVKPYAPFTTISCDSTKTAIALFISEFLNYALRAPMPEEKIFDFIETSIMWLDATDDSCANFHISFLLHLSHFLGFRPNVENFAENKYFDLINGDYTSVRPQHNHYLKPEEASLLPKFMRMKYATSSHFMFSREQRYRLLEIINEYYTLHLPNFPELKSINVLREVFS